MRGGGVGGVASGKPQLKGSPLGLGVLQGLCWGLWGFEV